MLNEPSATAVAKQSSASPPLHSTTLWQDECSLMTCTPEKENAPAAVHHRAPTRPGAHWSHGPRCIGLTTEAVRGWCQATQPPDPAITQLKFVHAHKDGLADHVCYTQICPSLKIIPNTSGRNATAQQSCQQHSCAVAAKPGSST